MLGEHLEGWGMDEEGEEVERRPAVSHQLSRVESSNLRDLLSVREDSGRGSGGPMTLGTALASERREHLSPPSAVAIPSRTLLDVIKDEDDPRRLAPGGGRRGVSWKVFKDRLRLRHVTAAWSASSSSSRDEMEIAPGSPRPVSILGGPSALLIPSFTTTTPRTSHTPGGIEAETGEASEQSLGQHEGPMKVSLMALLEQQERSGPSFAATVMGLIKDEEEEDESGHGGEAMAAEAKEMCVCCVCMVRHKGAAFIPCGHTFCRLCSRELWASRGNCPLCNGYIREILDIF